MKIDKLTKEQKEKLSFYRDKWLNKIFKYELYNSVKEKDVHLKMKELYKFCNLKEPLVILVDSPFASQIAANIITLITNQVWDQVGSQVWDQVGSQVRDQVRSQVWDQVGSQVWDQVGSQVWDQVRDQVGSQVWDQVRDQAWNQVWDQVGSQVLNQVRDQVGSQVWDQVGDQVESQVWDQVGSQVWDQVRDQVGSQVRDQVRNQVGSFNLKYIPFSSYMNYSDFGWLSFYDFFINEFNIIENDFKEKLQNIISFVDTSFMSIQLEGLCIVSRFPELITRNSQNQLHNLNDFAIRFKDGYGQHYFNGNYIDPNLFQKLISKTYSFEDWTKESNEETKSLVLAFCEEKFGGEFVFRFLSSYLKEVDSYVDKKSDKYLEKTTKGMNLGVYTLFKGTINNLNIAYVRCFCPSTDRMFFLGVNDSFNSAKDAIASLCQVPVKLKNHLTTINRQGEIFSFNFDEIGTKMLKNQELTQEDYKNTVSLSGDEYFNKIKFEY